MRTTTLTARDGARAEAYLHGAHVTSWRPAGTNEERLFLSGRSEFRPGAAIRGGIPVIFPQFAAQGPLPKHGFARTAEWELADESERDDGTATFRLASSHTTRAIWPHDFLAELAVAVEGRMLQLQLAVTNTGDDAFTFTGALHTYLRVDDIGDVVVHGLHDVRYRDSAAGGAEHVQAERALRIAGEVDRIYFDAPREVEVREPARVTYVRTTGFPDVVVWNPGRERASSLADLEPGGWARMLCIEAAVAGTPARVSPGERWSGTQTLIAEC